MTNGTSRPGEAPARAHDDEREARIARGAWLLAGVAIAVYAGYIAWFLWRNVAGG
jgi:hypothetical protein